jgi:hypothetical protein
MTFRKLSEVLQDVLADLRIDEAGSGCSDERAPTPAHPDTRGTEFVATGHERERTQPVAFARRGEETRAQTVNGKKAGSRKAPRQLDLGGNSQTSTDRNWTVIAARLYGMYRCMGRDARARAPRATRPIHLCIDNRGHDTAPKARRRWSSTKAAPTSVIPAMQP